LCKLYGQGDPGTGVSFSVDFSFCPEEGVRAGNSEGVSASVGGAFVDPAGKPTDYERPDPGAHPGIDSIVTQAYADPAAEFE